MKGLGKRDGACIQQLFLELIIRRQDVTADIFRQYERRQGNQTKGGGHGQPRPKRNELYTRRQNTRKAEAPRCDQYNRLSTCAWFRHAVTAYAYALLFSCRISCLRDRRRLQSRHEGVQRISLVVLALATGSTTTTPSNRAHALHHVQPRRRRCCGETMLKRNMPGARPRAVTSTHIYCCSVGRVNTRGVERRHRKESIQKKFTFRLVYTAPFRKRTCHALQRRDFRTPR